MIFVECALSLRQLDYGGSGYSGPRVSVTSNYCCCLLCTLLDCSLSQSATIRGRFRFQAIIESLSLRFYQLKQHSDFIKNVHIPRRRNLGYLSWYSLTSRFWFGIYLLFWKSKPLLL